jgi:WD40 repeat protein
MSTRNAWLMAAALAGCVTLEAQHCPAAGSDSTRDSAHTASFGGVTVRARLPVRSLPISEVCPGKLLPILAGSTALVVQGSPDVKAAPGSKPAAARQTDAEAAKGGLIRIEVLRDTPLYVGVIWHDDGPGPWAKELTTKLEMSASGWALAGNTAMLVNGKKLWHWLYWREAKAGENFSLRTRKSMAPLVVVPPQGAANPLADGAIDRFAETIAKEMLKTKTWYLLNHERFDELETQLRSFRKQHAQFPSGVTKLRMFYEGMGGHYATTDAQWQHALKCIEAWAEAHPESATPRVVWGEGLRDQATSNTWYGYTSKRTKLTETQHQLLLQRSGVLLEEAAKLDEFEPEVYRCLTLLAIHLRWPPERVHGFLRRSAAADPTYLSAFYQAARYCYLRQDGGPPVSCAAWAREAAELTRSHWGDFAYTVMLIEAQRYLPDDELFSPENFSWAQTKQGFLDAEKRLPHSDLTDHQFCALACIARDRETAHTLFERLGNRRVEEFANIWGAPMYFEARRLWALPDHLSGEQVRVFCDGLEEIDGLAWTLDGKRLITVDRAREVRAWDLASGQRLLNYDALQNFATSLSVSSDGSLAATGDWNNEVILWGLDKGHTVKRLGKHPRPVMRVIFSPDGTLLASAGQEGSVMLWNVAEQRRVAWWKKAHDRNIRGIDFTPDGKQLVTCGDDKRTKFWNVESGQAEATLPDSVNNLRGLLVSPDGRHLALADTRRITLWKLPERTLLGKLEGEARLINEMAFSADSSKLACVTGPTDSIGPGGVIVWEIPGRRRLHDFKGHKAGVAGVSFSPDGKQLATGSMDLTIRIWQVEK